MIFNKFFNLVKNDIDTLFLFVSIAFSMLSFTFLMFKVTAGASACFYLCFITLCFWMIVRFIVCIVDKRFLSSFKNNYFLCFIITILFSFLSLIINYLYSKHSVLPSNYSIFLLFIAFLMTLYLSATGSFKRYLVNYIFYLSLLVSIIAIVLFITGFSRTWSGLKNGSHLTLNLSNSNLAGIFLMLLVFFVFTGFFLHKNIVFRIFILLTIVMLSFMLFLTSSRSPIIAIIIAIIFMLYICLREKITFNLGFVIAALPLIFSSLYMILIITVTPDGIIQETGIRKGIYSRYVIWLEQYTFIGSSLTNLLIGDYLSKAGNAHNSLLSVWTQYGAITLLFVLLFFTLTLKKIYEKKKLATKSQYVGVAFFLAFWFVGLLEGIPIVSSNGMFSFLGFFMVLMTVPLGQPFCLSSYKYQQPISNNKIVILSNVYSNGSIGKIVRTLHLLNLDNKIDSYVIYGRGDIVEEKNVFSVENVVEVVFTKLTKLLLKRQYLGAYLMTKDIIEFIIFLQPQIVHIHSINDDYLNFKMLFKFLSTTPNIKVVYTHHSEYLYTGYCGGHALECEGFSQRRCRGCDKYKKIAIRNYDAKEDIITKFNRNNFYCTSVSSWLHNRALRAQLLNGFDDVIVLNGSDIYKHINTSLTSKREYVLYVTPSFDNSQKRGNDIIELAKMNPQLHFIVISLKKCIVKDIPNNVEFIYSVTNSHDLALYYFNASVTVLTGTRETFSMPLIESLLCGTPVVSYECGGPESLGISKKYATFVENGNVVKLSDQINIATRKNYDSSTIHNYAKKYFSDLRMWHGYNSLYRKIAFNSKKKILISGYTKNFGGIENTITNLYMLINHKYDVHFLCSKKNYKVNIPKIFNEKTTKIFYFDTSIRNSKRYKEIDYFFKLNSKYYSAIVVNFGDLEDALFLRIANKYKIPIRVSYAHMGFYNTTNVLKSLVQLCMKMYIHFYSTHLLTYDVKCTKSTFLKKDWKNAKRYILINKEKYKFNYKSRIQLRKEYNIKEEDVVIGSIGSISPNKNQAELCLRLTNFAEKNKISLVLFLIGSIVDEQYLKEFKEATKAANKQLRVVHCDNILNVNEYYSLFDLYISASKKEGFATVLSEAYINGLNIVINKGSLDRDLSNFLKCKEVDFSNQKNFNHVLHAFLNVERGHTREYKLESFNDINLPGLLLTHHEN